MKKFWKNFWLRARLFKIWFLKNILLFLQIALMVCLICTFLGCISAETPILGKTVYPMFKPLVDEVRSAVEKRINTEKSKIQKYIIKMRQIDKTSICLFYVEGWEKQKRKMNKNQQKLKQLTN